MRAETLKGYLDGLPLATLDAGPWHGYAIIEAIRAGGGTFDLPTGTVYPALHRFMSVLGVDLDHVVFGIAEKQRPVAPVGQVGRPP